MSSRSIQKVKFIFADFLGVYLTWILFYLLKPDSIKHELTAIESDLYLIGVLLAIFWLILYYLQGTYRDIFQKSRVKEVFNLFQSTFIGSTIIFICLLLFHSDNNEYSAYFKSLAIYAALHFFISSFCRTYIITHIRNLIRAKKISFPTLIVGANHKARSVYRELSNNSNFGLAFKGYVQVLPTSKNINNLSNLGNYRQLPQLIQEQKIEEIVIAIEPSEHQRISEILGLLEGQPVRISILPDLYHILLGSVRVNQMFGTPLIEIRHSLMPIWLEIIKRTFDIVVSLLLLFLLIPVYVGLAIMVKLSSPGPIIYGQERIGKGGVPFYIYKFRSMYVDAEKLGPTLSYDHDPRVTPFGQFMRRVRLDELPQFYNVLIGNMSIVGPRPERKHYIDQIITRAPHYKHLLRVKPGITSLGLVKFGYAQDINEMIERLQYDILYIENMSLAMDFRIILYTFKVIIEGRGK